MKMLATIAGALALGVVTAAGAATPEANFKAICGACHTIGEGKRVGPDLKGVTERRSEAWLLAFIKSSQAVIKSGDPVAVQLFEEHNKTPMPDAPYSEAEILEILAFIKGGGAPGAAPAPAVPEKQATAADVELGAQLFQGLTRLANRGPACNSCHHVKNDAVIGGGVLAKELTQVFSRMGAPGVRAILGKAPFPVMEAAYKDHPIQDNEVFALVAFLQDADKNHAFQQPVDYGTNLLIAGGSTFLVLAALYALIGRRRKVLPVNHAIFARQVKSQ